MVPFPLNAIAVVLLVEIFGLFFHIIFYNLCAGIFIKVSVSVIITWSSEKRKGVFFYFLFFVSRLCCLCFILNVSRLCTCSMMINFVLPLY